MACSALIRSVKARNFQEVFSLLESGADVNELDETYSTALHYAVDYKYNDTNIIKMLLMHGANVHSINKMGTPLDIAVRYPLGLHAVQLLLSEDANPNFISKPGQYERQTALHHAAIYGTSEILKLLLKKGANPNVLDGAGNTPLHWAVSRCEPVEALLVGGANPMLCGPSGITPLHALTTMGDEDTNVTTAELLISKGASVNAKEKLLKQTPLHYAAKEGAYKMCHCLIKHGAQMLLKDGYNKIPGELVPEKDRHLFDSFSQEPKQNAISVPENAGAALALKPRKPVEICIPDFNLRHCFKN